MPTLRLLRHVGAHFKIILIVIISAQILQISANAVNVNGVNLPIGGRLPLPTQVLLPPHREEGQSLDDIIYGIRPPPPPPSHGGNSFRNGFTGGSRSPSPPPPPPPPLSTTPVTTTTPRFFLSSTTPTPVKFSHNNIHNHARVSNDLVQNFIPPPAPLQAAPTRPLFNAAPPPVAPHHSLNSAVPSSLSSAEEIKVPQTVKHRPQQRKQYTKADLIAAANSLKPAGFDFNKVLIFSPGSSKFNASVSDKRNALARTEDVTSSNSLRSLYEHVMFPLPLFDTPVFNDLRPLMEMLLKQQQQQQGNIEKGKRGGNNDNSDVNKNKVLLIIPKNMFPAGRATGVNVQRQDKPPSQHQNQQSKPVIPSPSNHQSKFVSPSPSKFIIVPKGGKLTTTNKPKSQSASSFGSTSTTKRTSKQLGNPSTKATTISPAVKKVAHVSTKGPDLQVAATSNKRMCFGS